jgi:dephospho-CoA kinase
MEELNAIVHPAVIARQAELMRRLRAKDADAVAMVESALVFETKYGGRAAKADGIGASTRLSL